MVNNNSQSKRPDNPENNSIESIESILDILEKELAASGTGSEAQSSSKEMDLLVADLLGYLAVDMNED